jgi:hypothetical protein
MRIHADADPQHCLKFTDPPRDMSHMCPHFSDSSTTWPPSKCLFCHTDFLCTDRMFCVAVSFTNLVNPHFQALLMTLI